MAEKLHCMTCNSLENVEAYRLLDPHTHKLTAYQITICDKCKPFFNGLIKSNGNDCEEVLEHENNACGA